MKINEDRKAIIELISPYMEKTLSEGCLYIIPELKGIDDTIHSINLEKVTDNSFKKCKIYGHYDITAVLKYISMIPGILIERIDDDYIFFDSDKFNYLITIPNKPLHLYDTSEDEMLLDLLLKLK